MTAARTVDVDWIGAGPEMDGLVSLEVMGNVCPGPVKQFDLVALHPTSPMYRCETCPATFAPDPVRGPTDADARTRHPRWDKVRPYSTDAAAASEVFEALLKEFPTLLMAAKGEGMEARGLTTIYRLNDGEDDPEVLITAPTRALAICRLALKLKGVAR